MPNDFFKCPQCGTRSSKKKILKTNYACPNLKCPLNVRLLVHGEVTPTGKLSKLYGWVLEPGMLLKKKYKIIKMIGKGGFGATYLAHDRSMFDQLRAIKEIPLQYCDEKEDEFLTLLSHPAIPKLYERFNLGKFHYSVMEFIEGESLEEIIKQRSGAMLEHEVLGLAEQTFDVLSYIHSQNVVHRDLKPDNILIKRDGTISLIDFGIAKKYQLGYGTRHLARAASSYYSSPEQYRAGKGYTDFQSDVYSLGAILYFISAGVEPTDALSRDLAKDITPLPGSLNSKISKTLEGVIVKAMKMKKSERYKSIDEMKKALFGNGKTQATKLCPRCKAAIQPDDKFCRNCGSSTHPIKNKPVSYFVFQSKKKAANIQELVQICYQDWNAAVNHLYHGDFENWLGKVPEGKSLAKKAETIRKNQSDHHLGLHEFLLSSGYGIPPQIQIYPTTMGLTRIQKGKNKNLVLSISNTGKGYLKGTITCREKWIRINQQSFACIPKMTVRLILSVDTKQLDKDKTYQTSLVIHSNGGDRNFPLNFIVVSKISRPKSKSTQVMRSSVMRSYVNPIFLFLLIAIMIRHLGPTASLSLSQPWVIIVMAFAFGILNIHYGKIGFILGGLIGACLGAVMNIFAYLVYAFINQNVVIPVIKFLTKSYTIEMSYGGWGLLAIYLGVTYIFFKKRGNRNKN